MNTSKLTLLFILLSGLCIAPSLQHSRFVCPVPRSTNYGIKNGPCGNEAFWSGNPVTVVQPGPYTFRWAEIVNHNGAPYRIALSWLGDNKYNSFVLINLIPHSDTPASSSDPKQYSMTVDIPNINCEKCALQLLNPMVDKFGSNTPPYTCTNLNSSFSDPGRDCFSIYHSCADVTINGTMNIDFWAANYQYFPPNDWSSTDQFSRISGTWIDSWLQGQDTTAYQNEVVNGECVATEITTEAVTSDASMTSSPGLMFFALFASFLLKSRNSCSS